VAFVRYKTVDGNRYYQIVHNHRENGKLCLQVLDHLGRSPSLERSS